MPSRTQWEARRGRPVSDPLSSWTLHLPPSPSLSETSRNVKRGRETPGEAADKAPGRGGPCTRGRGHPGRQGLHAPAPARVRSRDPPPPHGPIGFLTATRGPAEKQRVLHQDPLEMPRQSRGGRPPALLPWAAPQRILSGPSLQSPGQAGPRTTAPSRRHQHPAELLGDPRRHRRGGIQRPHRVPASPPSVCGTATHSGTHSATVRSSRSSAHVRGHGRRVSPSSTASHMTRPRRDFPEPGSQGLSSLPPAAVAGAQRWLRPALPEPRKPPPTPRPEAQSPRGTGEG